MSLTPALPSLSGVSPGFILFGMKLVSQGAWLEPMGLRNFAILDPSFEFLIQVTTTPIPVPTPKMLAFAITILYKPDPANLRSNWPPPLLGSKADGWPPDLSAWETDTLRRCSVYFLYEQWHPNLDDMILKLIGFPRFAIKLEIPRLTFMDVMMMYVDIGLSMMAGMGVGVGGAPPAAAALMSAVNDLLVMEFSIQAELSLLDAPDGVPEWQGEPIRRGLYLHMTSIGSFIGFTWDFFCMAKILMPDPGAHAPPTAPPNAPPRNLRAPRNVTLIRRAFGRGRLCLKRRQILRKPDGHRDWGDRCFIPQH